MTMTETGTKRAAEDYLELPYKIVLVRDRWEDGTEGWFAEVEELPGCMSQGRSPEKAVANVQDAMLGWISVALEDGKEIPEPRSENAYSGRFLLRVPRTLHAALASEAKREGISLNQFATSALAAAIAWRRTPPTSGTTELDPVERALAEVVRKVEQHFTGRSVRTRSEEEDAPTPAPSARGAQVRRP